LQRLYRRVAGAPDFIGAAIDVLQIDVQFDFDNIARIPAEGPLVIAANHPHGVADGLAAAAALRRVRSDVKLLGNDLLARIPEMHEHLVTVDAFRTGAGRNVRAIRAAIEWVRRGHALVVFPAGEVSHVRCSDGRIVDAPWRDGVARIAASANAPVVPMFVAGRNSPLFVAAGRVHPLLRTALLVRELLRLRASRIVLRTGRLVSHKRLMTLRDAPTQAAYLRVRCYGLAPNAGTPGSLRMLRGGPAAEPIAPPIEPGQLASELCTLPAGARLLESGAWQVFRAEAHEAPLALREIARLREITFRGVGEGTGRCQDLDRYDGHYLHLFVWHRDRKAIAGAYRVALTDRVVQRHGTNGLYTRALFRYRRRLLRELGPSLELGRSFVAPDFQREHQPLLLLWRGIGRLVASEPRYRRLFGPVSISADYGTVTRQILARFLLANRYRADLGALVRPKHALPADVHDAPDALVRSTVASRLDQVEEIVRELEADQRGIPVLLRQYLKLNAKLLGFSIDPAFGHVLDGLVVVDLLDVDQALLTRYLGKEGAAAFLAWHRNEPGSSSTVPVLA
jgi:putative hemolysin